MKRKVVEENFNKKYFKYSNYFQKLMNILTLVMVITNPHTCKMIMKKLTK